MNRIEQLEAFLKDSPQDPFLHYALTMEYVKLEMTDLAFEGFKNLVENFPNYVGTYYHFGKFLEKQGKKDEGIEIYQKGILVAQQVRNFHALNELRGALNLALELDEDDDY